MSSPFHQPLQRIPTGTELTRLKTNEALLQAWLRDAALRLSDESIRQRTTHIQVFLREWGSNLVTDLSVPELRSYIEARAATCKNFRRGGMTRGNGLFTMPDRCTQDLNLQGCGLRCPGYEPMTAPTLDTHLAALKDFYDLLVELGLLPFNLLEQAKKAWRKKNRHRMKREASKRHLSQEEVLKLYHGTQNWGLKISIAIGCKDGPRASEIARLRVDPPWMDPNLTWMRVPRAGGNNGKRKGNDYLVIDNELRRVLVPYLAWRRQKLERVHGDPQAYNELVITHRGTPLPRARASEAINEMLEPEAVSLGFQRQDAPRGEAVTSHCLRRYFSNGCMKNGLYNTRLEILRGDKPKNRNETAYGDFTDADIRSWYEQFAPTIGF
ncbi:MAG: hypothetical protein LC623_05270 [Halobacteriales archaeon]|nr:hypothetical protein [Halobacteriales archaeon]